MENNSWPLLLTVLTILGGGTGIGGIIVALSTRRKSKGEATKAIEEAATHLVEQYRMDNMSLRQECVELKAKVDNMECRLDEQDVCQTGLKQQVAVLEAEKRDLMERVTSLQKRIDYLEEENRRLKGEI